MKKLLLATAALIALPALAHAQSQPMPGFYIGGEGGLNWMFNTTANAQSAPRWPAIASSWS